MSRTHKDIPQKVFYKQKTGKDQDIVTNYQVSLDDVAKLVDSHGVSLDVKLLSTKDYSYGYYDKKRLTNCTDADVSTEYRTYYKITSDNVYWLQYFFIPGKPLPYELYEVLKQYEETFGDCVLPPLDDNRIVVLEDGDETWKHKDYGFIRVWKSFFNEGCYDVACVLFGDDVVNLKEMHHRRKEVSGEVRHELKKHGFYPYMHDDYDYPNPAFDNHKQRLQDNQRVKDLVKYANSGKYLEFDEY